MKFNDELTQKLAQAASLVMVSEDNSNDKSDDGEGLDKVQPKAVKKKFDDRKDKDIDNDGDVDSSDEYIHAKRKAISKAVKKEDVDLVEFAKLKKSMLDKMSDDDLKNLYSRTLTVKTQVSIVSRQLISKELQKRGYKQNHASMKWESVELEEGAYDKLAKKLGRINPETLGDVLAGKIKLSPAEKKEFDSFMKGARKMFASESTDLEEAKMTPKDAEIAQEIIRSEDEKVSVVYGQKLKVDRQRLIKKYGKGWAKMVESDLEESVELEEATELFKQRKLTLTKFAMGKGKMGLQVTYGTKFIQIPEEDIKQLYTAMVYITKSVPQFKESTELEEATMSQGVKTAMAQIYSLEKSLKAGSNLNKGVNKSLEGKYDADFKKMEKAIGQIITVWEDIERDFTVNESVDLEKANVLTSDEYDEVQNFQNFNKKDWRWLPKQGKYIRKKKV